MPQAHRETGPQAVDACQRRRDQACRERKAFHQLARGHTRLLHVRLGFLQVISRGMANRKIGSHQMNLESSRSHSIATVYCETGGGDTGQIPCYGKVSFVDLAGSERVKDTKTAGGMLKETSAINRSLFTLGKAGPPPVESDPPRAGQALLGLLQCRIVLLESRRTRETLMIRRPVKPCSEQGHRLRQPDANLDCSRHRCLCTRRKVGRAWALSGRASEGGWQVLDIWA